MREAVLKLVKDAVQELNEELESEILENPDENTPIFGGENGIDSLSLVSLIVSIESETEDVLDHRVLLSDEKAMSQRNSPYRTVGTLTDFIVARFEEENAP